jgi:hypothetical protein
LAIYTGQLDPDPELQEPETVLMIDQAIEK